MITELQNIINSKRDECKNDLSNICDNPPLERSINQTLALLNKCARILENKKRFKLF